MGMKDPTLKVVCAGLVSGMRSMGGLALVSHYLSEHPSETFAKSSLGWIGTPRMASIAKFLAAGEILGDKLPMTPNRISPGPLFGRVLFGSLCGASLYAAAGKKPLNGAGIGFASAILGAFGFFTVRMYLGRVSKIPDPVIGAVEDALAYAAGWSIVVND